MEGWVENKIEDLCVIGDGNHSSKYPKKSEMVESGVPFIRGTNLVNGVISADDILFISREKHESLKKGHLKKGDVLFTNRGEIGKVAIVDERFDGANLNSQIAWLRCHAGLLPEYLFYFLQSAQMKKHFSQTQSGAALQQFTIRMLRAVLVSNPSLPEQKRIVAILDEAFAGIDAAVANTEKNLANARELFESYLNGVFTRKGDGWVEKKLSSFMDISHGFAFKGPDFKASSNVMKPIVLTPGNYSEYGELYFTEKNTKRFTGELPKNYLFEVGELTVVMTDLSSKMKILGKPAFIDQSNILHNQRIGRVIFKGYEVLPRLVYYYLRSQTASKEIKKTSTGTMVRHTAPKRILALNIAFPPTEKEQVKIVSVLEDLASETQHLESIYQQKLTALAELKQSILQKAFAGEL